MRHKKEFKISVIPRRINIFIDEKIKGIINFFCFEGATGLNDYFNKNPTGNEINISIKVVPPNRFLPDKKDSLVNFSKYYRIGKNQIYFFRKILFFKLGVGFKKIDEKNFHFSVTIDYLRFIRFRIEHLCPLGIHLFYLLFIETIKKGDLILYGGAFLNTQSNKASLVMAPSGIGKTYSLLKLIEDKTFKILSEEVSYLDFSKQKLNFICMPNTLLDIEKNKKHNIFANFFSVKKGTSISDVLGSDVFSVEGTAQRIYLLENSEIDSIERVPNNEENFRKVMAIQHSIFSSYWNELLCAYSYYYDNIDLDGIYKKEEFLLRYFFYKAELFIVKSSSLEKFPQLIRTSEISDLSL